MGVTWVVCGGNLSSPLKENKTIKYRILKEEQRCMHLKTEMKRKVGKEPEGGSKKRKEVGNESPLASISASLPDPVVVEKRGADARKRAE